jgi:hypothetical protein
MLLIWGDDQAKYFFRRGWTGSISLIGFDKFAVRRKGYSAGYEPKPSLRAKRSNQFRRASKEWIASSLRASQ